MRSAAQLSRIRAHGSGSIPESLIALVLVSTAKMKDNQQVSILAACVNYYEVNGNDLTPSAQKLLKLVRYESIGTILRNCDCGEQSIFRYSSNIHRLCTSEAGSSMSKFRPDCQRSSDELPASKQNFPFHTCHNFGY